MEKLTEETAVNLMQLMLDEDWDAIATAAANAIREQVMRQQVGV